MVIFCLFAAAYFVSLSHVNESLIVMPEANLIEICSIAFAAVMVLLTFLAGVIRCLTSIFAETQQGLDPTIAATVSSVVAAAIPGAKVIRIEEIKHDR